MSKSLPSLENDRSEVLRQISHLGDLRPGSIVEVRGRCSKSNCHCAQAGDPGHGPHFRLTRKVQGKTVAETLSHPAALRKAQREVAVVLAHCSLTLAVRRAVRRSSRSCPPSALLSTLPFMSPATAATRTGTGAETGQRPGETNG